MLTAMAQVSMLLSLRPIIMLFPPNCYVISDMCFLSEVFVAVGANVESLITLKFHPLYKLCK